MANFYEGFKVLSPEEYQNSFVDFYNQTLGSTGIQTTKPKEEEDKQSDYVAPTIIPDSGDDQSNLDFAVKQVGGESVLDFNNTTYDILEMDLPATYQDHLNSVGRGDKSDLSKFESSFNSTLSKTNQEINKNLQKNFDVAVGFPDVRGTQKYAGTKAIAGMLGANPFIGSTLASAVAGTTEKSITGKPGQFKPSGVFGIVQDVSESLKLNAYNANKAAYAKAEELFAIEGGSSLQNYMMNQDIGFSATIGGQDIYRKAGERIYNGAMYGMTQEQALRLEALTKGKSTYNFDPLNPNSSESLVATDKEGGYDERGNFHDGRFGVSAVGRERNAVNAAKNAGVTYNQFMKALSIARSGTTTLSKAIQEIKDQEFRQTETKKTTTPTRTVQFQDDTEYTPPSTPQDTSVDDVGTEEDPDPITDYEGGVGDFDYNPSDDSSGDDNNSGADSSSMGDSGFGGGGGYATAMGGRIGMREGGNTTEVVQPAGFIAPDPNATDQQEIADDKPMDAKEGDFIINAPAAEEAGKQDIQRMISTAVTNLQEKGVDVRFGNPKMNIRDRVKLLVSRNEVYIPAIIAKEIGYDRLKKINNRGKREVQRRQEQAQQQPQQGVNLGGFIQKKKGDTVVTIDQIADSFKKKYSKVMDARRATDEQLKSMPTADLLTIMAYGEAKNLGEEGVEGVMHVLMNRSRAKGYRNFGKSLPETVTSKYGSGEDRVFEFNALEPRKYRETINALKKDKDTYLKYRNIAEEVLADVRDDFTGGAMFFYNPNSSGSDWYKSQVKEGKFLETARTVSPTNKKTLHVYHVPSDFKMGVETRKMPVINKDYESFAPRKRIPDSIGGSFLFRGSDYETGGATPAF